MDYKRRVRSLPGTLGESGRLDPSDQWSRSILEQAKWVRVRTHEVDFCCVRQFATDSYACEHDSRTRRCLDVEIKARHHRVSIASNHASSEPFGEHYRENRDLDLASVR